MSDIAIRVEGLGKLYRIGRREKYYTLRDTLMNAFKAPFGVLHANGKQGSAVQDHDDTIWALRDVSFEIKQGEVVGVIGRNGAGKSTLLKILSRVTDPTEGYAEVYGRVGSLLEVGTGFHPELTGRENIYLNGAILGMKRREIDRKFDEIVAFAEVEKFIDTPVKHYSSGMHTRLAFAVAAHLEPEILLVDEVLAVGDAAFQKKCMGKIEGIAKGGRTVLFVSHNMAAIRSLCSHAFLLSGGQLVFSGSSDECVDRYLLSVSDDLSTELNTATLSRPSIVTADTALRITRIRLDTPSKRPICYAGQALALDIEFHTSQTLADVVFAWSVHSSDHVRLFECQSIKSTGPISELSPGKYRIRSMVPKNPLNPGLYTLHVGARCASKGLDYLPDVMAFRVESPDRYGSLWLELPSGFLRMSSDWTDPLNITENGGSSR